jgi:YidC/Oxa1 family membrane protein insertase
VGGSVEILGSPFFWIPDLAAADPYLILPMVFTLSFVVTQSKMTMDPSQKALIYIMPVMLFVMMMHLPSGVMLYIVGQSLFTNVEQAMIKARIQTPNGSVAQVKTDMEIEKPVKNKKKKSKE